MTSADARYALQASLFDDASFGVELGELGPTVQRRTLTAGAWVDVRPGWMTGSDDLFTTLAETVPWNAERRQMYDRVVDVPRLVRFYREDEPLPDPLLVSARDALSRHYRPELGEEFATSGLCFYRDGADSVAWHGDDTGRSQPRTRWSPSCRSAPRVRCCCVRAAAGTRSGTPSATVTCW